MKLDDLIEGRVDAISAYVTAEPSQMRARGVEPHFMKASDYGIDFYGDTLFTREEIVKERPADVEAMIRATRRGWHYALEHRAELIAHILTLPGVRERASRPPISTMRRRRWSRSSARISSRSDT